MSALTHAHVNGLDYTWRLVDKKTKESLKQMSQLLSDTEKYKAALDSDLQQPSVPILRIHLRDLSRTYKEMQTQVRVGGEELVNFEKFTEVGILCDFCECEADVVVPQTGNKVLCTGNLACGWDLQTTPGSNVPIWPFFASSDHTEAPPGHLMVTLQFRDNL